MTYVNNKYNKNNGVFILLFCFLVVASTVSAQEVGVGNTTFTPKSLLHVHDVGVSGQILQLTNGKSLTGAVTNGFIIDFDANFEAMFKNQYENASAGISFWTYTNGGALTEKMTILNSGNVGVGTDAPDYELDVNGDIGLNQYIYHNGDADTYLDFTDDQLNFYLGNVEFIEFDEAASSYIRVNDGAANIDIRVEGTGVSNLFRTDAGNNRIGIGTGSPEARFEVYGVDSKAKIALRRASDDAFGSYIDIKKTRGAVVEDDDCIGSFRFLGYDTDGWEETAEIRSYVDGTPGDGDMPGRLAFYTTADGSSSSSERMTILNSGRVGIGTNTPIAALQIASTSRAVFATSSHSSDPGNSAELWVLRSRGTEAIPTSVKTDDTLGFFALSGYDGSTYLAGASILGRASDDWSGSSCGTDMIFTTVENGETPPQTRITIFNNGNVCVGASSSIHKFTTATKETGVSGNYSSGYFSNENTVSVSGGERYSFGGYFINDASKSDAGNILRNIGVYSEVSATDEYQYGVYGYVEGAGTTNYGVYGIANGAGTTNYGVYGSASNATTNWAGYFDGHVSLTDGDKLITDEIRAIDGDGLKLYEDGGAGIFIEDGGKVGIGTTSPFVNLDVVRSENAINGGNVVLGNCNLRLMNNNGANGDASGVGFGVSSVASNPGGGAIIFERTGSNAQGQLHFATKSTTTADTEIPIRMTIGNDGSIIMPNVYSDVVGGTNRDLYIDNTGLIGYVSSSRRYKKSIKNMENINWFYKLRPVNYIYKKDEKDRKQYGLIAEEVEEINPLFVSYNKEGKVETVNYSYFISPLIKAVQNQKNEIEQNKEEIEKLKVENSKLRADNNTLKAKVDKIDALEKDLNKIKSYLNSSAKK